MSDVAIPVGVKDLFEDSNLVQFCGCMKYVLDLREAIAAARDATIRGTDGLPEQTIKARKALGDLAADLLAHRLEEELNRGLEWLDAYYDSKGGHQ
jgi:hypothetical protein